MESICEKLDETLLDFFDILEQLYQQQACLGDLMKSGFLDLSRSRYNMGTNFVTPAQFNEDEMKALVKLEIQQDNGNTVLRIINQDSDKKKTNEESKLRKRNVVNDDEKGNKLDVETIGLGGIPTDENESASDGKHKKSIVDPINWFGVLVPQNLRRSQSSFKAAIDVSVTIANLKLKLQELKITYRKLLADKEELL
ncbi:coiled-coil domain-containing protein 115-like [Gigantopelta aegis]|uniref:coiled-coil domain-containing protein 115-like n=1 Tax=Gigantopelta aegis TaxID=1735272 RepID=UPI001B88E3E9|nr:coiled-coil domain-containing protein 115-like [Gigantopelta aegis]